MKPNKQRIVYILTSTVDEASMLMKKQLLDHYPFQATTELFEKNPVFVHSSNPHLKLVTLNERFIFSKAPNKIPDATLFIYASKHSSVAKVKTLTAHTTGVWTDDDTYGGPAHEFALAPSFELFHAYHSIKKYWSNNSALSEYVPSLEVTHHGPTDIRAPLLFIEQGGTLEEWSDPNAAQVTSASIMDVAFFHLNAEKIDLPVALGIGGNHYCARFMKIIEQKRFVLGHIAPKYVLDSTTEDDILRAFERSLPHPTVMLIDKKGTRSNHRSMAKRIAQDLNLEVVQV